MISSSLVSVYPCSDMDNRDASKCVNTNAKLSSQFQGNRAVSFLLYILKSWSFDCFLNHFSFLIIATYWSGRYTILY